MREKTRLRQLKAQLRSRHDPQYEAPRAAGKTHLQACQDYVAYLNRLLTRPHTPPEEQELIRGQIDKIRAAHPELE